HRWSSVFFFSSRRRHTRSKRDWSSDVCSSDLIFECIPSGIDDDLRREASLSRPPIGGEGVVDEGGEEIRDSDESAREEVLVQSGEPIGRIFFVWRNMSLDELYRGILHEDSGGFPAPIAFDSTAGRVRSRGVDSGNGQCS